MIWIAFRWKIFVVITIPLVFLRFRMQFENFNDFLNIRYMKFLSISTFVLTYLKSLDISAWNLQYTPISRRRSTSPFGDRYKIDFTAFSRMTRDGVPRRDDFPFRNVRVKVAIIGERVTLRVFVCDKSSRASTVLAQCRTNLPSRTHDITTPAWRLVIYHPAANLHYV